VLGIPAGPLLNSAYCAAAFKKGFDIAVYKTVRSGVFPSHPFPNVLAIHPDGDLDFKTLEQPVIADATYTEPLSITNSFGVPSKDASVWQEDVQKAIAAAGKVRFSESDDGFSKQTSVDDVDSIQVFLLVENRIGHRPPERLAESHEAIPDVKLRRKHKSSRIESR
jgi:hypothetical protein